MTELHFQNTFPSPLMKKAAIYKVRNLLTRAIITHYICNVEYDDSGPPYLLCCEVQDTEQIILVCNKCFNYCNHFPPMFCSPPWIDKQVPLDLQAGKVPAFTIPFVSIPQSHHVVLLFYTEDLEALKSRGCFWSGRNCIPNWQILVNKPLKFHSDSLWA